MSTFPPYTPPLTPKSATPILKFRPSASKIPLPPSPTSLSNKSPSNEFLHHASPSAESLHATLPLPSSLRHTSFGNEHLRPPPLRIARKPLNTIPSLRPLSPFPQPLPSELLGGRKTPDRTFLAPKVTWRSRIPMPLLDEEDEEVGLFPLGLHRPASPLFKNGQVEMDMEEWNGSQVSLGAFPAPPVPVSTPVNVLSPASSSTITAEYDGDDDEDEEEVEISASIFSTDEPSQVHTAHTVSIRTISLTPSIDMPPLIRCAARESPASRSSRFTEHMHTSRETMYASSVQLMGSRTSLKDGLEEDIGDEKDDEKPEDGKVDAGVKEKKQKKGWKGSLRKGAKWMVCCAKES